MNPATNIQGEIRSLSRAYQSSLAKRLLRRADSISKPHAARKNGNRAGKLGVGLRGLATIHQGALGAFEKKDLSAQASAQRARRSAAFFDLVSVPIEASHFTASETNNRLNASTEILTCRTQDLDRSNKQLLAEIAHRKKIEKSLRTSQGTTSLFFGKVGR